MSYCRISCVYYLLFFRSLESAATHDAKRKEQQAYGELERQKLETERENEKERCKLLGLQAEAAAVESSGQATAEAKVHGWLVPGEGVLVVMKYWGMGYASIQGLG